MDQKQRILEFQAEVVKERQAKYSALEFPESVVMETSENTFISFEITSCLQGKPTKYIGTHANSSYFIEFIPAATLSELKTQLQSFSSRHRLKTFVKHLNRWHTSFMTDCFVLLVFTPKTQFISVAEWSQTLSVLKLTTVTKSLTRLSVQMIVKFALFFSKAIFNAHTQELVLGCVSPENCYFHVTETDIEFALDIGNPHELSTGSPAKDLQDLGAVLFALCLGSTDSQKYSTKTRAELDQLLSQSMYVPGLTELVVNLMSGAICSAHELMSSQVLCTWRLILKGVLTAPLPDNIGRLTGLYFDSDRVVVACLEGLAKDSPEWLVRENSFRLELLEEVFRRLLKHAATNTELRSYSIEFALEVLQTVPHLKAKAQNLEVYRLLKFVESLDWHAQRTLVTAFLKKVTENNTLTALNTGRTVDIIIELTRVHVDEYFLQCLPYLCLQGYANLPDYAKLFPGDWLCLTVKLLAQLPMHRKRRDLDGVVEALIYCLVLAKKKKITSETLELLQYAVAVVYQVFIGGHAHYQANLEARCFKETHMFSCEPVVAVCSCRETLCFWCTYQHVKMGHQFEYMLYMTEHPRRCSHKSDAQGNFTLTGLYNQASLMFYTDSEQVGTTFSTSAECPTLRVFSIDKVHPGESSDSVVLYYEVTVLSGGYSDNVCVGLDWIGSRGKTWIQYQGSTGNITKYGKLVAKGPRFGTTDRIGVGFLRENVVFFTYNGYNIHAYVRTKPVPNLFPLVQLNGEGMQVHLHLNSFLFGSYNSCSDSLTSKLKAVLAEWSRKLVKFKPKDSLAAAQLVFLVEAAEAVQDFTDIKLEHLKTMVVQQQICRHSKVKERCCVF